MSVERFLASDFACLFEGEDRDLILDGFSQDRIGVSGVSVDACFARLSQLPATSRLSWGEIPHLGISTRADKVGAVLDAKIDFIRSVGSFFGLKGDYGLLFEDLFADLVLRLPFETFGSLSPGFFRSAGHKYLLSETSDWLINVTMEEQFYFTRGVS